MVKDTPQVDPKWVVIADKLRRAADELVSASDAHAAAVGDRDAADAALRDAIDHAQTVVRDVADTPPGTFPAITS
jgi:hypothetical protein